MKVKAIFGILILTSTALIGCGTPFEPSLRTEKITDNAIISGTPSLSGYTVKQKKDGKVVCLGRGSDAAFEQSENADISIALISTGGTDAGGESESTGEQEMAGRTPSVLIAREIFYRVCELSSNYNLDKKEALALFKQALEKVSKSWLKETENTTVTIGDKVITNVTTDRSNKVIDSRTDKITTSNSDKISSSKSDKISSSKTENKSPNPASDKVGDPSTTIDPSTTTVDYSTITNESDCDDAGGAWSDDDNVCSE